MKRLLLLPVVVTAALSLTGCRSESPAISVNGVEISIDDFDAELRQLASNTFLQTNQPELFVGRCDDDATADAGSCRVTTTTAASWASNSVLITLFRAEFASRGLEITEAERAEQEATYPEGFLSGFSDEFAARWVENDLMFSKVAASLAPTDPTVDPVAALQQELVAAADVVIDPRYGTWDPTSGVSEASAVGDLRLRNWVD